ncbi:MAG: TonB-dependent receptor [Gammaproteobacteria bacterium]|nr:TonB-dependent receptor [Gammaproteobacteria bacterium]
MSLRYGIQFAALVSVSGTGAVASAATEQPEEIIIQGSRLSDPVGIGVTQVDAAAIARQGVATSDVASLLREVPGVSAYGAGGVSSLPVIHGLADDRLRIKVDGMDLIAACPNHMNPALSYLDPAQLGNLQVFAGIAPVSAGGDSIGGTIVAETAAPEFAGSGAGIEFSGEVGAFYRSNDEARGAHLGVHLAGSYFSLSYAGSFAKADDYTAGRDFKTTTATGRSGHTLDLDVVGSSAYETNNHALTLALKNERHLLEARLGYQAMPLQSYPNQRMDLIDNTQYRANLRYVGSFDRVAFEARIYYEGVAHAMDFGPDRRFWYGSNSGSGSPCSPIRFMGDPAGTCAGGMPMQTEAETLGVTARADLSFGGANLLRVGTEYQRYRLDDWWSPSGGGMGPGTFWNIRDGQRDRFALFSEWETQLDPRWLTSLGARFERVETSAGPVQGYSTMMTAPGTQYADSQAFNAGARAAVDHNWDVTALSRYSVDATVDLELGYAHKVRSPNLYERYPWSSWAMAATMNNFVGDGNGYVGNPLLQPEQAHTLSATFDWHSTDRDRELRIAPFYTRVRDYIDAAQRLSFTANRFNVLTYANQSARLAGIDVAAKLVLARTPVGVFTATSALSYTDGKNRVTKDALYNIMPLNGRIRLNHQYGGWDAGLELLLAGGKQDVATVRNEIATAGYELVNLTASYTWERLRLDAGIDNLFDRYYQLPLGGAYVGQGSTMSINGIPWGVAVPGKGRSFNVALTAKF